MLFDLYTSKCCENSNLHFLFEHIPLFLYISKDGKLLDSILILWLLITIQKL